MMEPAPKELTLKDIVVGDGVFETLLVRDGSPFDLFTSTHTENHFRVSQDIFLKLLADGDLFRQTEPQWYSPEGRYGWF